MDIIINGEKVNDKTVLTYVANPKRLGSKAQLRYEIYSKCGTLGEYLTTCAKSKSLKGYARADLRWDAEKGYLSFK